MTASKSLPLWFALALLTAGLVWYSQTAAYAWDEGFHLLTAQLITRGKTPYLDFFFPQTPLNAYWNALWMLVFGDTWRTAHAVGAIMTALGALLAGDFVLRRMQDVSAALTAMLLLGMNAMVVQFGPVGQAYGLCLVLLVGAFRLTVAASEETPVGYAFGAGLLAAASASASLLTAPAAIVLWLWLVFSDQNGSRAHKSFAFIAGCVAGAGPVLWFLAKDPARVLFEIVLYNLRYRGVTWDDVGQHDLDVLLGGIDSAQALVLGICGTAGAWIAAKRASAAPRPMYLCAFLAAALGLHIATARPTFDRYFLFITPWLAILAGVALHSIPAAYRRIVLALVLGLTGLGLGKSLYEERDSFTWGLWEQIARKVDEVTPKGAPVQADEHVYLITRRTPPEGMEHENSHKTLPISDDERRHLHIVSKPEMEKQIRAGVYATVATCDDEKPVAKTIIQPLYRNKWELEQCTVYWNFKR